MTRPRLRQRLSLAFAALGVALMGIDLLITRDFFVHTAELMAGSIASFLIALLLDRRAARQPPSD